MAVSAYICTLMFILLLTFAVYNTWNYLIKQGKWRVFSLSMFYGLTILCLIIRIIVNIMAILVGEWFNVTMVLFPAIVKFCIGIV